MAVTPAGDRIIIASAGPARSGRVRVWDAATLDLVAELPDQPGTVYAVAVTPAGDQIITAGIGGDNPGGWVRTWDAATLDLLIAAGTWLPAGILLCLLGILAAPPVSALLGPHRLPPCTTTAEVDEYAWATVRYLNSYRHGDASQRQAARRLIEALAVALLQPRSAERDSALAGLYGSITSWDELTERELLSLEAALRAVSPE